ncbi:hypothetical protein Trydic_g9663 [Trypoxylus dichotomus]
MGPSTSDAAQCCTITLGHDMVPLTTAPLHYFRLVVFVHPPHSRNPVPSDLNLFLPIKEYPFDVLPRKSFLPMILSIAATGGNLARAPVLLDLSKTYDMTNHRFLLDVCIILGLRVNSLSLLEPVCEAL